MFTVELFNVFIFLTYVSMSISLCSSLTVHDIPCDEPFTGNNGNLCYPCSPGFYFVSDCTNAREQAKCAKCLDGQYQPNCTLAQKCAPCTRVCPPKQVMVKDCHFTSNAVCQCVEGRYFEPELGKPNEGVCRLHSLCAIGTGLLAKGTPFHDTKCIPCKNGHTYSDNKSLEECQPCKSCEIYKMRCSPSSNAICGNTSIASEDKGTGVLVAVIVCPVAAVAGVGLAVYLYRSKKIHLSKPCVSYTNEPDMDIVQPAFITLPDLSKQAVCDQTNEDDQISTDGYAVFHMDPSIDSQSLDASETSAKHVDNQVYSASLDIDAEPAMPRESSGNLQRGLASPMHTDQVSEPTVTCTPTSTERQNERDWQIVTDVMTSMKWADFLWVFRRLAAETNEDYFKTIDVEIDNELFTQHGNIKECIYQLIKRYRQTTPTATWRDVNAAMIECLLKSESEKLVARVKSSNIMKTSGREPDIRDTGPTVRRMRYNQENNLQHFTMDELKEHYV